MNPYESVPACSTGGFGYCQEQRSGGPVSRRSATGHQAGMGGEAAWCSQNKRDPTMGLFTKDIKTMNDLFVHQLRTSTMPKSSL